MIQGHIFLVLLLMIIGATVLWTFISSSGSKWSIKAIMTLLVVLAILSSWVGLKTMYGYPYESYPNHGKYFPILLCHILWLVVKILSFHKNPFLCLLAIFLKKPRQNL